MDENQSCYLGRVEKNTIVLKQNSKAIVTKINTSSDRFKTDFETWFSAQKDGSMHIILLNAGWRSMVIGYKTNSKYGKFIQINYNTSSNAFCTVLEGKITWGV